MKRILATLFACVLICTMIPLGAVQVSAETQAEAISRIAISQVGLKQTDSDNDYAYGAWCARFVAWCARQAGISTSIISNDAGVANMRNAVLNGGGYEVSSPQAGDLIFYHDGSGWCHTALIINATESIHGNYDICYKGCSNASHYQVVRVGWNTFPCSRYSIVRPNYTNSSSSTITYTTISEGVYYLKNQATGTYLDVEDAVDANKTNIHVSQYSDWSVSKLAQQYTIRSTPTPGGYMMMPACSSSRVVNVYGDTVASGNNVCLWSNTSHNSQRWRFQQVSGGYIIRNLQVPNCVLDVDENRNVCVCNYHGGASQIWSIQNVITYNANGGSGAPGEQFKEYGKSLTLSSTKPTRSGYTFAGWSTSSTATSATYQPGGSFTTNANTTLYAVWKNLYTVSYNANGGSGAPSSQTKTHGMTLTLSSTKPTRSGYTFLGWSTSSTATSATYQPGGSFTTNANTTLYAVWKLNSTILSENSKNAAVISTGGEEVLFTFTPTTSGKYMLRFTGGDNACVWFYREDGRHGSTFYIEEQLTAGITYKFGVEYYEDSSTTGTILFDFIRVYIVSYDANGGSNAPSTEEIPYGSWLSEQKPTREGYTFLGWATSRTATSATDQAGDTYTTNADTTLYAVWEKIPETVGDINSDGSANMRDALMLYQAVSGGAVLTEAQQTISDINGDGTINMRDVLMLYQQISG